MSDNRTTELLREGLTERGIEWKNIGGTTSGDGITEWIVDGMTCRAAQRVTVGIEHLALYISVLTPEQAIAATLGSDNAFTREEVESAFVRGYSLGSLPVGSDPQWDENRQTVDEHMAELGWVRSVTLGSEREKALEELVRDMWREMLTCPDYATSPCMTDDICERVRNLEIEVDR